MGTGDEMIKHDTAGDPNAPDPDYVPVGRARKLEWNAPLGWLRADVTLTVQ